MSVLLKQFLCFSEGSLIASFNQMHKHFDIAFFVKLSPFFFFILLFGVFFKAV